VPLSPEALSISVPHDPFLSGTWSGDVLINDSVAFNDGGPGLFQAMLHEAGHVLGLDHSDDPASVMAEHLDNARVSLAPSDVAAIQALYGPRGQDPYEGPVGNETLATAASFPSPAGHDGTTPLFLYADIASPRDSDIYSVRTPDGYAGPMTVRLQTSGVSLLAPRLTLYDNSGRVLADLAKAGSSGDTLRFTLPRVDPGATYSIQARAAAGDLSGVGEYAMAVTYDARSTVPPDVIDRLARQSYGYLPPDAINAIFRDPQGALFQDDHHTDDTFASAADLEPSGSYGSEAPARITASLGDFADVDVYRIETPDPASGGDSPERPLVMTVTGRAPEVNGLMPRVEVFDASRAPVPAVVLARGDGTYSIQADHVRPGTTYFIRVTADPASGKVVGNYELDVEYGHDPARPVNFVASTIDRPGGVMTYDLEVDQAQLFDFLLSASGVGGAGGFVTMRVVDGSGRVVDTRAAGPGETAGGDPVFIVPGSYRVEFAVASSRDGGTTRTTFPIVRGEPLRPGRPGAGRFDSPSPGRPDLRRARPTPPWDRLGRQPLPVGRPIGLGAPGFADDPGRGLGPTTGRPRDWA